MRGLEADTQREATPRCLVDRTIVTAAARRRNWIISMDGEAARSPKKYHGCRQRGQSGRAGHVTAHKPFDDE